MAHASRSLRLQSIPIQRIGRCPRGLVRKPRKQPTPPPDSACAWLALSGRSAALWIAVRISLPVPGQSDPTPSCIGWSGLGTMRLWSGRNLTSVTPAAGWWCRRQHNTAVRVHQISTVVEPSSRARCRRAWAEPTLKPLVVEQPIRRCADAARLVTNYVRLLPRRTAIGRGDVRSATRRRRGNAASRRQPVAR